MTHTPNNQPGRGAGRTVVPVLAFAGIAVAVMQTLLVPVIKDLPRLLNTAPSEASWVVTSTLLSGAVATPIMGRLGDLHGKRRMLILSLTVMIVGTLISALSSTLLPMLVGRTLQGFALGALPLGIGLMRDTLPRERLGSAMGLMGSAMGVGGGLALPAAALVAQHMDWHVLFYGAAGLGTVAIVLTLLFVPETTVRAKGSFDLPGAVGLSAGLVMLLLPITKGGDWGWTSAATLGLFAGAVVTLVLWGLLELRRSAPLVDLRTTARPAVLFTNLVSIMIGVSFFTIMSAVPAEETGAATGINTLMRSIGTSVSSAVVGMVLANTSQTIDGVSVPTMRGFRFSFLIATVAVAIGVVLALFLPRARRASTARAGNEEQTDPDRHGKLAPSVPAPSVLAPVYEHPSEQPVRGH
ncbi:MFS transporter [Streptomyces sp. NPDC051662]|uniref:MFS transporter n=1 Tax=Streptomyces sp. NPDC051662 TaxID=3154750 RepID=UPI00341FC49B